MQVHKIFMKCIMYQCFISNDLSNCELMGAHEKEKKNPTQNFLF